MEDGFTISVDDVVELWVLADRYQLERLKFCCLGSLERFEENNAVRTLKESEELSCPCDELKKVCLQTLTEIRRWNDWY